MPYFLNSFLSDDKAQLRVNLTNPDLNVRATPSDFPRNSIQLNAVGHWAGRLFHRF